MNESVNEYYFNKAYSWPVVPCKLLFMHGALQPDPGETPREYFIPHLNKNSLFCTYLK